MAGLRGAWCSLGWGLCVASSGCQAALDLDGYAFQRSGAGGEQGVYSQEPGDEVGKPAESIGCPSDVGDSCEPCPGCRVEGTCWAAGAANPSNPCEVCDPLRSAAGWSSSDFCGDGRSCDTSSGCVDACRACSIDGICVDAGAEEPGNPCRVCDPAQSMSQYSNAVDKACDDGLFCGVDDQCQQGICTAGAEPRCDAAQRCDEERDVCQPLFLGIGAISVRDMDALGTTIVGSVQDSGRAVRWTPDSGIDVLDTLGTPSADLAQATSADGSVIVGRSRSSAFADTRPYRWTAATGIVPLPGQPYGPESVHPDGSDISAAGASADGSIIVGTACVPFPSCTAFLWTAGGGFEDLGNNGSGFATAYDVSADGSTVVGDAGFATTPAAYRWTRAGGLNMLATEADWHATIASAVSSDGSTTVGSRRLLDVEGPLLFPERAVRWVSFSSVFELPVPESWGFSIALDVSSDGNVIVGRGGADDSAEQQRAWMWDFRSNQVQLIEDVLSSAGVDLTDWRLTSTTAVSDDGRVLAGSGMGPAGPSAWVARLP